MGALGLRWLPSLLLLPEGPPAALRVWPGVELLGADRVAEVAPGLAPVAAGLLAPYQAQVHPLQLAVVLARRAGSVATRIAMVDAEAAGGRIVRVRTTVGDLQPGVVVLATGLAPQRWVRLPQRLVKGHLVATEPARFRLRPASTALVWGLGRRPTVGCLPAAPGRRATGRPRSGPRWSPSSGAGWVSCCLPPLGCGCGSAGAAFGLRPTASR